MTLESNVVWKGTTSVVPPFKEAIGEDETALGSDEMAERGLLVAGFCPSIKCANSKLSGSGFTFCPMGNEPPSQKLDSTSVFTGDDW